MNPGGGPTPDKPDISVVPYEPSNEVSTFLNPRVADIDASGCLRPARGSPLGRAWVVRREPCPTSSVSIFGSSLTVAAGTPVIKRRLG
jgi:hypothetical protein